MTMTMMDATTTAVVVVAAFAMASLLALLGVVTLAAKTLLEWKVRHQRVDLIASPAAGRA